MRCCVVLIKKLRPRHHIFAGKHDDLDDIIGADQKGKAKNPETKFAYKIQLIKKGEAISILFFTDQILYLSVREVILRGCWLLDAHIQQTDP